jgi:helicase MOV-10
VRYTELQGPRKRESLLLFTTLDLFSNERRIVTLQRNRRSHGAIIAWPNRYLYEDNMRAAGDVGVTHLLVDSGVLPKKGFPIMFHGIKGREERTIQSPSYFNIFEASIVRDYCVALTLDRERKICECGRWLVSPPFLTSM